MVDTKFLFLGFQLRKERKPLRGKIHPITLPVLYLLSKRLQLGLYQMDSLTKRLTQSGVPNDKNKSNCMIYFSVHLPSLRFSYRAIGENRSLNPRRPPPVFFPLTSVKLLSILFVHVNIRPNKNPATTIIRDHGFFALHR